MSRLLKHLGVALAVIIAGIHFFHPDFGIWAAMTYLSIQSFPDPRPFAFVLSAVAILLSIALVADGAVPPRVVYFGGMVLMVTYIVGYFAWHVLGHGAWWPWGSGLGSHAHTLRTVLLSEDHLRADPIALTSKFAELALLVVLAVLYRRD